MKRILITGADSYIGESVRDYLMNMPELYDVKIIDTVGWEPHEADFTGFDVVFNVAGIAHIKETAENRPLYYAINRDLAIKIAQKAKAAGVKQFILLSTMSVYGIVTGRINKTTPTNPVNAYGRSKAKADEVIKKLADDSFKFACLRPPMVYGRDCKGNYQRLRKFALSSPVFPDYKNQRSMIYIGNLCEFVKDTIDQERSGLFFPQNSKYTRTSDMVKAIARCHGKKLVLIKAFNGAIKAIPLNIVKKVFGDLVYEKTDTVSKYGWKESIRLTEEKMRSKKTIALLSNEHSWTYNLRKEIIQELIDRGYQVILILPYGEKVELLKDMGCRFYDVPMFERRGKNPITELRLIGYYYKLLKKIKPDVVLTYTIKPNLYGGFVAGKLKIPYIANITGLGTAVEDKGLIPFAARILYRIGLRKAKCVFAQNKGSRIYLLKNRIVTRSQVKRIPGSGVNLDRFSVASYPDASVIRFVFISRVMKEKGIEEYLKAASVIKRKYRNVEFHVCGFCEEEYRGSLKEKERDGTVIYHGMIDNVPEFLVSVHCLIHPSFYLEGLSNVCLEAAASGRPVITTDHEGCRETIIDGKTGYLVKKQDDKSLIGAIEKFLSLSNNEKKAMGSAAQRYVEKNFDRRIIVDAYMKELQETDHSDS